MQKHAKHTNKIRLVHKIRQISPNLWLLLACNECTAKHTSDFTILVFLVHRNEKSINYLILDFVLAESFFFVENQCISGVSKNFKL